MCRYKLIIFDLDGTLIDSKKDIVMACNHTLDFFGYEKLSDEKIHSFVGLGLKEFIQDALKEVEGNLDQVDQAIDVFKAYYEKNCAVYTDWYTGVEKGLAQLNQKAKLAILTNKPITLTNAILEKLPYQNQFLKVIGSEDTFPRKPDPTSTHHIMDLIKASPNEVLFVGDSEVDAHTAKNANIDCVLFSYGFSDPDQLKTLPHKKCFDNFDSFLNWIEA
jgi:2-phosphoglycolate phosphatase